MTPTTAPAASFRVLFAASVPPAASPREPSAAWHRVLRMRAVVRAPAAEPPGRTPLKRTTTSTRRTARVSRTANLTASTVDDTDRLLDAHAAAAFLGVAPRTLYKWAAQGRLPVVRLGRAVRFRVSALRSLVREHEERAAMPLGGAVAQLVGPGTERAIPTRP